MRNRDGTCQKRDKKISFWVPLISQPKLAHSQKIVKKLKKLKNIILALFLAKLGWDRP